MSVSRYERNTGYHVGKARDVHASAHGGAHDPIGRSVNAKLGYRLSAVHGSPGLQLDGVDWSGSSAQTCKNVESIGAKMHRGPISGTSRPITDTKTFLGFLSLSLVALLK